MRRRFSKREYVLGGLFALIALFPLATKPDGEEVEILPPLASVVGRREVLELRDERTQQMRMHEKALDICVRRGDAECPDVNNYGELRQFMRGVPVMHNAAFEVVTMPLTTSDLTDVQGGMLRRYMKVRTCPTELNDILPGFFDLCTSILEDTEDTRPRLQFDRMIPTKLFPVLEPTLDQLIKMQNPE